MNNNSAKTLKSIILLLPLCASLLLTKPSFSQDQNVILIVSDDLRYYDFNSPDCPVIAPNIAALQEKSSWFSDAHANLPICAPSRASFLSGKYGHTSGYFGFKQNFNLWYDFAELVPDSSIFGHLKTNGYRTISAGKIFHEGPDSIYNSAIDNYTKWNHGPFITNGTQTVIHPDNPDGGFPPYVSAGPIVEFPAQDSLFWIVDNTGEFEIEGDSILEPLPDELVTQVALEELGQVQSDPFFMALGYYRPHLPFYAPQEYFDLYDINDIEIPEHIEEEILGSATTSFHNSWGSAGEPVYTVLEAASVGQATGQLWLKKFVLAYYASISFLDQQIGEVMAALDSSDYADNTVLIFTSDHGINLGEYARITNKNGLRSPSTKIPLMIYGPDIPQNQVVNEPVSLIDLYPTIEHIALDQVSDGLDGNSVLPLVDSGSGTWNGNNFVIQEITTREEIPYGTPANNDHQHYSIYNGTFRFNLFNSGEEEFFDLIMDPEERVNQAYQPTYQSEKQILRSALEDLTQTTALYLDPTNDLIYGGFEHDFSGWAIQSITGPNSVYIDDSNISDKHAVIERIEQDFDYIQDHSLHLKNGHTYDLKFNAKIDSGNANLSIRMGYLEDTIPLAFFSDETFELSTNWEEYQHTFTYDLETTKRKGVLRVVFPDLGVYELDDFRLEDQSACQQNDFEEVVTNLTTDIMINSVKFGWEPVPLSNKCEIRRNEASAPMGDNFADLIPEGTILSATPPFETNDYPINVPLQNGGIFEYDIEYRWRVRCGCSTDPIVATPLSGFQYFTIPSPIGMNEVDNAHRISIYPNPSNENSLELSYKNITLVRVYSSDDRLVKTIQLEPNSENYTMEIGDLSKGTYFFSFIGEKTSVMKTFIRL
ncbi:MAG: sulfatase-like hydrolase/transferase [Flavobacteriales bacterium]|nr:sulfatase-like hydrolase/transferase [Flavobacteriales bacterium]